MGNVSRQYERRVLRSAGWDESSVSIRCVSGAPPAEEPVLVVLASVTGAPAGEGVKAGLVG